MADAHKIEGENLCADPQRDFRTRHVDSELEMQAIMQPDSAGSMMG